MKKINNTFSSGHPSSANACVGNNGSVRYSHYAKGYSLSANKMIDLVLNNEHGCPADYLVYPVCFNMRHSVELRLKGAMQSLIKLVAIRGQKLEFDFDGSHDIGKIWCFFKTQSESFDLRYKVINDKSASTVEDIAAIDATGQTFRYPFNTQSNKHLVDVNLINFAKLKIKFSALEENLNQLIRLSEYLIDEYSVGTFTKNLSRVELFALANALPPITQWGRPSFKDIKEDIKARFAISSKELSQAINHIKVHYEMAPLIGTPIDLLGVDRGFLLCFFNQWHVYHHGRKQQNSVLQSWSEAMKRLTPENLAGLDVLYYSASEQFSEPYKENYKSEFENYTRLFSQQGDLVASLNSFLENRQCFSDVLKALSNFHHQGLVDELLEHFGDTGVYKRSNNEVMREYFELPDFGR